MPHLDRGRLTQNWFWNLFWVLERPVAWSLPGVLERFMVLVPLVLERPGFWDLAWPPMLSIHGGKSDAHSLLLFFLFHEGWCHILTEDVLAKTGSGTSSEFWSDPLFWNALGSGTLPGYACLSLVSMIDQNSRWQIGGPFLTTFLLVSLGLVPNLDRGRFTQNWFWNLF